MLETFPLSKQRILVLQQVHNNSQPLLVIYSALPQQHLILQRMRAKVDWQIRVLQAKQRMTSLDLMLLLNNNNSSHKCSQLKLQLLKLIIQSQAIYWTYSQQISLLAAMASSPKTTNLTISLPQIISHWLLHKTKSLIMTNTLSFKVSTTKISSSISSPRLLNKINSRLRATCRALTPSASWWIKVVVEWLINKTVILSTDHPPKEVVSNQWWVNSSQWAWAVCNSNSFNSNNSSNNSNLWAWEEWQAEWVCKLISLKGHLVKTRLISLDNLNSKMLDNRCQLEDLAPFNNSLNSPPSQMIYSISEELRLSKWLYIIHHEIQICHFLQ